MTHLGYYLFFFLTNTFFALKFRSLSVQKGGDIRGQITFSFQVITMLFISSFFLPFFSPFHVSGNVYYLITLSIICGVFGGLSWISTYIAQKHVEAGVTSIISNMSAPIAIIFSSILVKEGLKGIQILGAILLFVAMIIVSKKHHIGRFRFDKYFLLMLLGGATMGISNVTERLLQHATGFSAGTMFSWWAQFLVLGLAVLYFGGTHTYTKKEVLSIGFARTLGAFSWVFLVFSVGNLSIVSAVTTFKVVVVFATAAIFLKEREDLPRKIFGSVIALIGLLLMR